MWLILAPNQFFEWASVRSETGHKNWAWPPTRCVTQIWVLATRTPTSMQINAIKRITNFVHFPSLQGELSVSLLQESNSEVKRGRFLLIKSFSRSVLQNSSFITVFLGSSSGKRAFSHHYYAMPFGTPHYCIVSLVVDSKRCQRFSHWWHLSYDNECRQNWSVGITALDSIRDGSKRFQHEV